ncbi:MAG: hypothetical protein ACRDND_21430 [Streptosporangiaceae bacterium]
MMTQDRDYEDALRRALTAAAESIEPAGDGLQRIRHRLDSPRPPRSVFSRCAKWLELHGTRFLVRLEPATEAGRTALRRTGPLLALVNILRGLLSPRTGRRGGGHRGPAGSPGRMGPRGAWLKPVFAVSAAVAIVVVGVVILNHEGQTLIGPSSSVSTSKPSSGLGSGGKTANSKRWILPLGVSTVPATGATLNPHVRKVPVVACTPTPSPTATTTAPSATATPSPTVTPTGTPTTPSPTQTAQPTPTTSSPATGGTATTATTAALVLPDGARAPGIVECGASPKPSQTP